ncbi:MAG: type II toxin-antitoxin system HicB family antitoxin [Thermodesulfobacteriota bacterium]|nr:type II toxin-antitoxin system HicB family antitoxin [Thermodesulfobacteriota bacterium]
MIKYPAKVIYSKSDKCYLVEFLDLPGCVTYGETLDEAKKNANEALTGYLESIDLRKIKIPVPSNRKGKNIYYIGPEKRVAFALWLKMKRIEQGLTQKDMAKRLNINFQSYQKYENPRKTNPTLKTILKVESILKDHVLTV